MSKMGINSFHLPDSTGINLDKKLFLLPLKSLAFTIMNNIVVSSSFGCFEGGGGWWRNAGRGGEMDNDITK